MAFKEKGGRQSLTKGAPLRAVALPPFWRRSAEKQRWGVPAWGEGVKCRAAQGVRPPPQSDRTPEAEASEAGSRGACARAEVKRPLHERRSATYAERHGRSRGDALPREDGRAVAEPRTASATIKGAAEKQRGALF